MPKDVEIGAGYIENLMGAFPGQYRDSGSDFGVSQQPGASPGRFDYVSPQPPQVYSDPDHGRPMILKDLPGIGQVMVPVEHTMIGSVVPVEHSMVGMGHQVQEDLSGLGKHRGRGRLTPALEREVEHFATAIAAHAVTSARAALEYAKRGMFRTVQEAEDHAVRAVTRMAERFILRLRPAAAPAAREAFNRVRAEVEKAISQKRPAPKGAGAGYIERTAAPSSGHLTIETAQQQIPRDVGPWGGSTSSGAGDWYASMMGGLKESILSLVAGPELAQLARAMEKLYDGIIDAYSRLNVLRDQEAELARRVAGRPQYVRGPLGVLIPTPEGLANLRVGASIAETYKSLTGFDYMATSLINVFSASRDKLKSAYPNIDLLIHQLRLWTETWSGQIAGKPKYTQLWNQIQNVHNDLASKAGIPGGSFDHPQYLAAGQRALEQVLGIKARTPEELGMSDFGISAIIGLILICVTVLALAVSAVALAKQFNVVANNVQEQRLEYERRMDAERKEFMAKCGAEGATVDECNRRWDSRKKTADEDQKKKEEAYIKDVPSALDIGKYIPWAAGIVAAVTILPSVLGVGSIGDIINGVLA